MTSARVPRSVCEKHGIAERDAQRMYDGVWRVIRRKITGYRLSDSPDGVGADWFGEHTTAFKVIGLGTVYLPEASYRKILEIRKKFHDEDGKFSKEKWKELFVLGYKRRKEIEGSRAAVGEGQSDDYDELAELEAIIDNNLKDIGEDD